MSLSASVGTAQALDGREAAVQATQQALDHLGSANISFGLVFASYEFPIQSVLAGVSSLLSNTPLWGISTTNPIDQNGVHTRSVVVALIAGNEIRAQASWWANYAPNNPVDTQRLFPLQQTGSLSQRSVLVACDGFNSDSDLLFSALARIRFPIAGCLASAPSFRNKTYQIAGNQAGSNGLATLFLTGMFRMSTGIGHGWMSSGHHHKITATKSTLLLGLDGESPAKAYSQTLGHTREEWSTPPLADLVRLYPLGIEQNKPGGLIVRSPLRVNPDGSFLMNIALKEGSVGFLMIGTRPACLKAAQEAVQQAINGLQGSQPLIALVFCDVAWQYLFETQGNPHLDMVKSLLGSQVPVAGGYTFGQISGNFPVTPAEVYNQAFQVILLAG